MKPDSIDAARRLGWMEMTQDEVKVLRELHSSSSGAFLGAAVDCNDQNSDGKPCGGFGIALSGSVACFCRGGLCVCFRAPSFAVPPP